MRWPRRHRTATRCSWARSPRTRSCRPWRRRPSRYNFEKDLVPISIVGSVPLVFVVHPSVPAKTLEGADRLCQVQAGRAELRVVGCRRAAAPGGGDVQAPGRRRDDPCALQGQRPGDDRPDGRPGADHGRDRSRGAAAHPGRQDPPAGGDHARSAFRCCRTCPPPAEAGLPGFEVSSLFGILAPAGTPKEIITRLNAEITKLLTLPEVKEQLLAAGRLRGHHHARAGRRARAPGSDDVGQGDQGSGRQAGLMFQGPVRRTMIDPSALRR